MTLVLSVDRQHARLPRNKMVREIGNDVITILFVNELEYWKALFKTSCKDKRHSTFAHCFCSGCRLLVTDVTLNYPAIVFLISNILNFYSCNFVNKTNRENVGMACVHKKCIVIFKASVLAHVKLFDIGSYFMVIQPTLATCEIHIV